MDKTDIEAVFNTLDYGIMACSKENGHVLYSNKKAIDLIKISSIEGRPFWELISGGDDTTKKTLKDAFAKIIKTQKYTFELAISDVNNREKTWLDVTLKSFKDEFLVISLKNITEKKGYIKKIILDNEIMLRSINRNITDGVYRSRGEGGLIYVNEAFAEMFGYDSVEEVLKIESKDLYAHREDRKDAPNSEMKFREKSNLETLFKRKDGSTFWGSNNFILTHDHEGNIVYDGAIRDISVEKEAAEKLNKLNQELLERNKILAQKEQELASSNEELRANRDSLIQTLNELSDKNFELDQLIYRTSHDLRAPLRSILGLTHIWSLENEDDSTGYIQKIDDRIQKMDDFIKSMLEYSRASRMGIEYESFNLKSIIKEILRDLKYWDDFDRFTVETEFEGNRYNVYSDRLRIQIILGNIISNAFKYRKKDNDKSYMKINVNIQDDFLTLDFKDNGIGISDKYIDKIFDMFYRATEASDGSGLGMYIVKQCIDKLNASIDLKSVIDEGTEIQINIPLLKKKGN